MRKKQAVVLATLLAYVTAPPSSDAENFHMSYLAVPFSPAPASKLEYILTRLVEHDTWWSDFERGRRETAARLLMAQNNAVFEVWKFGSDVQQGQQPAGVILLTDILPGVDAKAHFIFFDGRLRDKTALLKNMMAWAFGAFQLHRLTAEIPDYAFALVKYAREQLGFRYEGEGRTIKQRDERTHTEGRPRWVDQTLTGWQAGFSSRRYQVVRWQGAWHDLLLLSITEEEFVAGASDGTGGWHSG